MTNYSIIWKFMTQPPNYQFEFISHLTPDATYTVEPLKTATLKVAVRWPLVAFAFPKSKDPLRILNKMNSIRRPPLYNGHFLGWPS